MACTAAASDLQPLDAFRARGQGAGVHTEAVTSRDELLLVPAKLVEIRRQKLKLAVSENCWAASSKAYERLKGAG